MLPRCPFARHRLSPRSRELAGVAKSPLSAFQEDTDELEVAIDSKKDRWIIDLYEKAVASANREDRQDALACLEDHLKRRN